MQFSNEKNANLYLRETGIENLFISEYMPSLPGEYLKVYLLIKLYAGSGEFPTEQIFARQLGMSVSDVEDAFADLQQRGLIRCEKVSGVQNIEIISLRDKLFSVAENPVREADQEPPESDLTDAQLAAMFRSVEHITGKPLSLTEAQTINEWIYELGATAEMVMYAYSYCVKQKGKDSVRYVSAVVKDWMEKGLITVDSIDEYIKNSDARHAFYRRVLSSLGMGSRNATAAEKKLMDKWLDETGYTEENVMFACEHSLGANTPSLKYIDGILRGMTEKGQIRVGSGLAAEHPVTVAQVKKYYEYLSQRRRKEAAARLEDACVRIPRLKELDDSIRGLRSAMIMSKGQNQTLSDEMNRLCEERVRLLAGEGLAPDYTEDNYYCRTCKDTGFLEDGKKCSCYEQRAKEAKEWLNSSKR